MFSVYIKKKGNEGLFKFPWKISIVGFMANPATLNGCEIRETFETIANDLFFDAIEIHVLSDEQWKVAETVLTSKPLTVISALQPIILMQGFNPNSLNEDERKKAVQVLKDAIKKSAERGIKSAGLCTGPDPGPENREAAKDALVKSMKEILSFAKKVGVFVSLEMFDRDYDKKLLLGPLDEAVEIAKDLKDEFDNFGLLWDLSHAPMLHEKPEDLGKAKGYLGHIHVGCTKKTDDGLKDWHPGFYRPGAINGIEDVKELIKVLNEIEYKGYIGFEVKPEQGQMWQEVVNAAKGVMYTAYVKYLEENL
ncbi:MAG: hypothetical protein B6U94_03530 [Thermofilum sp. ex4484_79]|nr:MAG: hypothetical protein B6U94_03530 [Thermofilum sp. ex4484_79]